MRIKIGSRKSDLARLQAYRVCEALVSAGYSDVEFQFKESLGDKNLTDPLWKIPEKGVFTEDFYQDLLTGKVDMVVHSWKDLPTEGKPETEIYATLPRADQRDLLFVKKNALNDIHNTKKLKLYSSSPRRFYNLEPFLLNGFPKWATPSGVQGLQSVEFENVRGNIPTRIRKLLESDQVHGLVLAKAAVDRLLEAPEPEFLPVQEFIKDSLKQVLWMALPLSENPTAAAQGALAIEILKERQDLKKILDLINHPKTMSDVLQERKILSQYGGGCHQKIGVNLYQGQFFFLKGLTDQGDVLNKSQSGVPDSENICQSVKISSTEMISSQEFQFFKRVPLVINENEKQELKSKNILVARFDNSVLPYLTSTENLVWSAGVETWKELADHGVWVSGTLDSLGENSLRNQTLCENSGYPTSWVKLTHTQSSYINSKWKSNTLSETNADLKSNFKSNFKSNSNSNSKSDIQEISYYQLVPVESEEVLAQKLFSKLFNLNKSQLVKSIYWRSASQFLYAMELAEKFDLKYLNKKMNWSDFYHASGAGFTYQVISKYFTTQMFYSEQDWRQQCQYKD